MKEILIVSQNNACRSAMAEGWFKYYARGCANVTSAGIDPTKLDLMAAQSMIDAVIDITTHQPKNYEDFIDHEFDYVIVMDNNVAKTVSSRLKYKELRVFHFDSPRVYSHDDNLTRKEYDTLRDEIENWAFDFIHENIKRLI